VHEKASRLKAMASAKLKDYVARGGIQVGVRLIDDDDFGVPDGLSHYVANGPFNCSADDGEDAVTSGPT
jgi:hypothetical protein